MISTNHPRQKVRAEHLQRDAYLYVRQSTLQQVFHNTESTQRQYDLKQRAVALGWPTERVYVIDGDQGQSGASASDREGFQRLVAEVGLGRAGIVLGLEVSRLARNCSDWHRLDAPKLRTTSPEVVRRIDQLLDHHTEVDIAAELNRCGYRSGTKQEFTGSLVRRIQSNYRLEPRYNRLRQRGLLTAAEIGAQLGITAQCVAIWKRHGLLRAEPYNDKNWCLYEPIGNDGPRKQQGTKLSDRRRFPEFCSHAANEVHHEA